MTIKTASVLAFERKLANSDALMHAGNWKNRAGNEGWQPIAIQSKDVRGTISNRMKNAIQSDPAKLDAEIQKANPKFSSRELFKRGMRIGREHIASMINTLALAYAGVSLPLLLLLFLDSAKPLWVILNSEFVAEEIVRVIVGSSALILAAPIASFLGAYFLRKR